MILLHNPRCSTSRDALKLLTAKKCKVEIRNYLESPLDITEIKELLKKLGCEAEDILRKKEKLYAELYADKKLTEIQIIKAIASHPVLLQRPIIIDGTEALIARPAATVLEILKKKSNPKYQKEK
jgi:arsenate reductase